MAINRIVFALIAVLFMANCSHKRTTEPPPATPEQPAPAPTEAAATPATPEPPPTPAMQMPWGYDGEKGPDHWASLNAEYSACGKGKHQSPINLAYKKPTKKTPRLDFSYSPSAAQIENNGWLTVKMTGANQLLLNGKVFTLDRIEFHSPSEHQLSKTALTMEMQLIHKAVEGNKMAVVSVFAIEGKENPLFTEIWSQLNGSGSLQLDASRMIPPNKTFYHYQGSLTSPPCTEGVEWLVFNTPMELSKEQIEAYRSKFSPNSRPLQPVNGRKVMNY